MAAANASGASSGTKCPESGSGVRETSRRTRRGDRPRRPGRAGRAPARGRASGRRAGRPVREPARPARGSRMPGPMPVPADGGRERPRPPVGVGEPVEVRGGRRVRRGRTSASRSARRYVRTASRSPSRSRPERSSRWKFWYQNSRQHGGVEQPLPGAGHRRGHHQCPDALRGLAGDDLGDAAADVVPGQDDRPEPELVEQPRHAAGLGVARVALVGRHGVLVGLAEPPQVRDDDVGGVGQQGLDQPVVAAAAGPPVQEHHRGARRRCGRRRGRSRRRASCGACRLPENRSCRRGRRGVPAGPDVRLSARGVARSSGCPGRRGRPRCPARGPCPSASCRRRGRAGRAARRRGR